MTKRELLFALMALPDDAEIMVCKVNDDEYAPCADVKYWDRKEDNTIWLSAKEE